MDNTILSVAHSPPSAVDIPGTGNAAELSMDSGQRKITLLTRPPQPQPTLHSSGASVAKPGMATSAATSLTRATGGYSPYSEIQAPVQSSVPGAGYITPVLGAVTRATRNDYYDTEDPSVNLHEFIVNSMQSQKNRVVLLKLEEMFVSYVSDPSRLEPLKLPPWDSYHRMLAHRVAAYFGLEHNVDPSDKTCVIVCKGPNTRMPQHRFTAYMPQEEPENAEPKLILKRSSRDTVSSEKSYEPTLMSAASSEVKSFEEREEEYEKARARIFNQQQQQPQTESSITSLSFDLGQPLSSSRVFPSVMHHRRTASDTATFLFNRPSSELKEGPSSNHSSRSTTPLFPTFLRPSLSQPDNSPQKQPQQHSPQPQKLSQPEPIPTQQAQHSEQNYTPPQPQRSTSQPTFPRQRTTAVPSLQFPHVQGIPMMYPQTTGIVPDSSSAWYYGNMLVYPVPPHQPYIQGQFAAHMLPSAVFPLNQPYPVAPGVIGQPALVSPPSTRPGAMRMAPHGMGGLGVDSVVSPSHAAAGVALVRPVPQQPLMKGDVTPWNYAPNLPGMQQHYPSVTYPGTHPTGQTAFSTFMPASRDDGQDLAEKMEQSLTIGNVGSSLGGQGAISQSRAQQLETQGHKQPQHLPLMQPQAYGMPLGVGGGGGLRAMNGGYPMMPVGEMISPTQVPSLFPAQLFPGTQEHQVVATPPGNVLQFPGAFPPPGQGGMAQPTTPPIGPLNLPPPGVVQAQQQAIFSPPSTATMTHSPVQILGHTLGTTLFSPPPSTSTTPHGIFVNSPTTTGKILGFAPGAPALPPVGSGPRFRRFESPKQPGLIGNTLSQSTGPATQSHLNQDSPVTQQQKAFPSSATANGISPNASLPGFHSLPLPPRLAQQQQQRNVGTRYQNQRHPANRSSSVPKGGSLNIADHTASQVMPSALGSSASPSLSKREPLLPTPPSTQMVRPDTTLTCGVPLNVVEVIGLPPTGSLERQQALQVLQEIGACDLKVGRISRTGEEVTVAIFESTDATMKALHFKHPHFSLSIPRSNHARFILGLLQISS